MNSPPLSILVAKQFGIRIKQCCLIVYNDNRES
jgi:hypothetical protein